MITVGGMTITKGQSYTTADFATGVVITKAKLCEAPRVWRKAYNQDGTVQQKENKYVQGNMRGVWILITRSTATYLPAFPNTPVLYKEGEEITINADNTYKFLSECYIEYGET